MIPYDNSNPVIYDNDSHEDVYTDEYIMALASSGYIDLRGIITTASYVDKWQEPEVQYDLQARGREEIVEIARRSGMKNIPDAVRGPSKRLKKPLSGSIYDTIPIDTPGSRLIVKEAKLASTEKPLVVIMGGQSTVVADAYLLDNSIADKVIVAWLVGEGADGSALYGYNGWADAWGTYIIATKFTVVAFGPDYLNTAIVPKKRLQELPETELRQYMIKLGLPHVNLPDEKDFDVQPAIALVRQDYIKAVERKSFLDFGENEVPILKDDMNGNVYMVTKLDSEVATNEWWRTLKDISSYGGNPNKPESKPYLGVPHTIPGTIAAFQYDIGGENVSYGCNVLKSGSLTLQTGFRATDNIKFVPDKNESGNYFIDMLGKEEWLGYTVDVKESGKYIAQLYVSAHDKNYKTAFRSKWNG